MGMTGLTMVWASFTAKFKNFVQHLRKYSSLFLDRFFNETISQTQKPYGKIPLSCVPFTRTSITFFFRIKTPSEYSHVYLRKLVISQLL